jgi:phage terminase large subunit-like protein
MNAEAIQEMSTDPVAFRRHLLIDADGETVPFCPDQWQDADFRAMDPGWLWATGRGRGKRGLIRRAWMERPRGHAKTSDLAVPVTWALLFSARPVSGIAAAADRDQAALLRDAIKTLTRLNSWMADALDVQAWTVVNTRTGSTLEILSSDVATSYGQLPDFVVIDELTHWRSEDLWISLFSAAAKRSNCILVAAMNAGFSESWQWKTRERIRHDPGWYFNHLDGPKATWITSERLEEQQRILPPLAYDRLWLNVWTTGTGDALASEDIQAAVTLLTPMLTPEPGFCFYAGLDLGITKDHCGLVLVGKSQKTQRLRLCQVRNWIPPRDGKVDLISVKNAVLEMNEKFHPIFFIDPYQAELLGQQLAEKGVRFELVPFAGKTLMEMASNLLEVFSNHEIDLFRHQELLSDLRRLRVKETPAGWRLDAARTATGHCDLGMALSLAILASKRFWTPIQDTSDIVVAYVEETMKPGTGERGAPSNWREALSDLGYGLGVDDDWGDRNDPWRR